MGQHRLRRDVWQLSGIKLLSFNFLIFQITVTSPDWRRWDALWGQVKGSRKSSYKRLQVSSDSTVSLRSLQGAFTNGRRPEESDPKNPRSHFWTLDTDQLGTGLPPVMVRPHGRYMGGKETQLIVNTHMREVENSTHSFCMNCKLHHIFKPK